MDRTGGHIGEFDWYRWEDLRFPAQGINPIGLPSPATLSPQGVLEFDGSVDNAIAGFAQMPHSWLEGSDIHPHIHLLVPASNPGKNSRWSFEYSRANIGSAFDAAYGSYNAPETITIANPADVDLHFVQAFSEISMAGMGPSAGIMWKISRLANSDGIDDDTGTWVLLEFDFHYRIKRTGTLAEF